MLVYLVLLTLWMGTASCKRSGEADNKNGAGVSNLAGSEETTRPPFATKEPERYQAVRVITGGSGETASISNQTFIARDGDRRREDYESPAGLKLTFLQLAGAKYVLFPAQKIYAEVTQNGAGEQNESVPEDFSPDRLLNEARTEARYESLGAETINGRATQKYRVTVRGKTGAAKEVTTETLIWVDDALGMPVKSETTSSGGSASAGSKVIMELREIKETVDEGLFALPQDYRKVEYKEILAQASPR